MSSRDSPLPVVDVGSGVVPAASSGSERLLFEGAAVMKVGLSANAKVRASI